MNFPQNYQSGGYARIRENPDPATDFSVEPPRHLSGATAFRAAIDEQLASQPVGARNVTIYVHGFYTGFFDGLFRSAQLQRDFDLKGLMLHFAWPSLGNNTGYAYDRESVLFSRDGLEQMLRTVAESRAERVTIIGHSLGAMLVMETLRQIEISDAGWAHREIDGIALVSPDIDLSVFKSQAARIKKLPNDFVVFVSDRDKVLWFSSTYNGVKRRLGNTTDVEISTEGELTIVDLSKLASSASSGHFIPATSPAAIKFLRESKTFLALFPRESIGRKIRRDVRLFDPSAG
ncbi:MAG: alpha/beta hydrolase [Maritimibacter sp.]